MVSWRAPGSILETPGLDFGGFGEDFFDIMGLLAGEMQDHLSLCLSICEALLPGIFFASNTAITFQTFWHEFKLKIKLFFCDSAHTSKLLLNLNSKLLCPCSVEPRAPKVGGRRWSPPGGFQ